MYGVGKPSPNMQGSMFRASAYNAVNVVSDSNPGVALDGSTMLYYDGSLTGQADTKTMLTYFRIKRSGTMGTDFLWDYYGGTPTIQHYHYGNSTGNFFTRMSLSTGSSTSGSSFGSGLVTNDNTWKNLLWAWDSRTGTAGSKLYSGDTQIDSDSVTAEQVIDFTTSTTYDWGVLGRHIGSLNGAWEGSVSHVYICTTDTLDITVESNRRKFFDASGNPTDLSTAPAPLIQFTGNAAAFNAGTNEGTGEDFSVVGTFTDN